MCGNDKFVTPVIVNGIGDIENSIKILEKTSEILDMAGVKKNDPILFSPVNFNHKKIRHFKIKNLTYAEYNNFIIHLGKFWNDNSYALICQNDGYPIYADNWTNEFLEYDYIGSPWGTDRPDHKRVGNGGFSLRSSKLLKTVSDLVSSPNGFSEDLVICDILGDVLQEQYNIKFAPISLAMKFSFEHYIPERNNMQLNECFGFHDFKCGPKEDKEKYRI